MLFYRREESAPGRSRFFLYTCAFSTRWDAATVSFLPSFARDSSFSFIGFHDGVGKSFSISLESFTRQNEIGAEGGRENEERAVNHAGKAKAFVERAKDEMDRQVKEREIKSEI